MTETHYACIYCISYGNVVPLCYIKSVNLQIIFIVVNDVFLENKKQKKSRWFTLL